MFSLFKNRLTEILKRKNTIWSIYSIVFSLTIFLLAIVTTQDAESRQSIKQFEKHTLDYNESYRFEKEIIIQQGQTLASILFNLGIKNIHSAEIISKTNTLFDLRYLMPGKKIKMIILNDRENETPLIELFRMETKPGEEIRVNYINNSYEARLMPVKTITVKKAASGSIVNSLYSDAVQAGIPDSAVMELFNLYSYDIDFQRDIYQGDTFRVLYENTINMDGETVAKGKIIYSELDLRGRKYPLYRFTDDTGRTDFFDSNGINVRKTLLRTPILGARISSGYGRRDHPIYGYSHLHKALDFAALKNTPIIASGSGTVELAGWNGGYGKCVIIRHPNQYKTLYAHLNSYANGIRSGSTVKQGQIIGYVGTTGVSTGYHLHYEVLFRGSRINPSTLKTPPEKKLTETELERFLTEKTVIDEEYHSIAG